MIGGRMRLDSRGDTIVEVLLAILVVGVSLAGAFVSARHSLAGSQRTQERSEAIKLVESQIELLRKSSTQSDAIFTAAAPFCIINSSGLNLRNATQPECRQGTSSRYALSITRGSDNVTFNIVAQWDKLGASGSDRVDMYYKVHQGVAP